jgi:hypothetical protein
MAITRSQIARQLMAEGGVSLDDAKRMAPKGEFLAYINPKEAQMLKDAGGSGIMTPMGIPSFIDYGDSDAVSGAAAGGEFGGGSPEDTFGGGDNAPDAVTGGAPPPPKTSVRDKFISGLDTAARFVFPTYGAVRGTMDISNLIAKNRQPKVINIVDEVALTGGRTPPTVPDGENETGIVQAVQPVMPVIPKLPTDIETPASDMQFVQRFTLPERFQAAEGGEVSVDDAERMAPPGESLAYINDDEAALLRAIGGAGEPVNKTGIPSFFIKKVFRKAKKAVKKIAKSPLGKAALIYGATAGLGALGAGKGFGSLMKFGTYAPSTVASNLGGSFINFKDTGIGRSIFGRAMGDDPNRQGGLLNFLKKNKAAVGIAAASALPLLTGSGTEDDVESTAQKIADKTGLDLQAIRKEVQDATAQGQDALDALASKYPFLVRADSALKDGGEVKKKKAFKYRKKPYGPKFAAEGGLAALKDGGEVSIGQIEMLIKRGADNDLIKTYVDGAEDGVIDQIREAMKKRKNKKDGGIMMASNIENDEILENLFEKYLDMGLSPKDAADKAREEFEKMSKAKKSGRTMAKDGGVMSLGGMEMDLRGGGFVPLGKKEKADDVPARLSKNEFVFTADAVRAAGGGNVDKGADLMYKTMKQLENRVL